MSTDEGPTSEPPFSEMINRWLEEGDRLSVNVAAPARGTAASAVEERESLLARSRATARRHPALASLLAGAVLVGGVSVLRLFAQSRLPAADARAGDVAATVPPRPAPVAPSPLAAAPAEPATATSPSPALGRIEAEAPPRTPSPSPPNAGTPAPVLLPAQRRGQAPNPVPAKARARAPMPTQIASAAGTPPLQTCKVALEQERARTALAACRQVADAEPDSADAIVLLAQADLLAGRQRDTLVLARRAQAMNPRCADAYLLIGNVEQLTGRNPDARTAYQTYLHLAPRGRYAADVRAILRRR